MTFKNFTYEYFSKLHTLLQTIDMDEIEKLQNLLLSLKSQDKIYIIGNGGSAATASHMANDFGIGLKRRNKLHISPICLSDNLATCSAIANDTGYENIFYLQLEDILSPHDVLIAISCSGNSPNIIKATNYTKSIGAKVVGLTGFDGGELRKLADISIHAQTNTGEYGLVEDVHMIINHLLYTWNIHKDD